MVGSGLGRLMRKCVLVSLECWHWAYECLYCKMYTSTIKARRVMAKRAYTADAFWLDTLP